MKLPESKTTPHILNSAASPNHSTAYELLRFKELLDMGAITQMHLIKKDPIIRACLKNPFIRLFAEKSILKETSIISFCFI